MSSTSSSHELTVLRNRTDLTVEDTDAAINIAPTLQDKLDIVRSAVDLAHAFGVARPHVAFLAAVETVNPNMPATLHAAALCKMADRGQIEGALVDGPLAFDNAVSAAAARTKGIVSEVAGAADIMVVPNLESGNMLAKQLEHFGGAASAGIVLGARGPAQGGWAVQHPSLPAAARAVAPSAPTASLESQP
ncbi:phosphate acyltransferase [Variovorax ginsengisoli]|uniref:phosphate acyltransferase n=1 Tax=Variovorax ginsengisoli TaxID=363844 RepID=UPI003F50DCDF